MTKTRLSEVGRDLYRPYFNTIDKYDEPV